MQIQIGDRVFARTERERRGELCASRGTVIGLRTPELAVIAWDRLGTDLHPLHDLKPIDPPRPTSCGDTPPHGDSNARDR
jgi:hypothetical protein